MCVYVCIYIYIYIYTERDGTERGREIYLKELAQTLVELAILKSGGWKSGKDLILQLESGGCPEAELPPLRERHPFPFKTFS